VIKENGAVRLQIFTTRNWKRPSFATQAVRNGKYTSAAVGSDHLCYFVTIGLEDVGGVGAAGVQSFDPAEAIDL